MNVQHVSVEGKAHAATMDALKLRLKRIIDVMPSTRPVIYLDYPLHENVGDLLIDQGANAFLKDHGYEVLGRFSIHDFAHSDWSGSNVKVSLRRSIADLDHLAAKGATLALHGGGSLGDVWPQFQQFRELIIQRYPANPIVILPQSVHFNDVGNQARAVAIFQAHKKLAVFVRDAESLKFFEQCGIEGEMLPDMAHHLWGQTGLRVLAHGEASGTLVQRRIDKESREGRLVNTAGNFDWNDLHGGMSRIALRAIRKWQTIDNPLRYIVHNHTIWDAYRDRLVRKAIARFQPYETINTDRLHGMILGALLGKTINYGDGTYGKLHRYAKQWFQTSDRIQSSIEK